MIPRGAPTFVKNKTYMWHDRAGNALEGGRVPLGRGIVLRLWMPFKIADQTVRMLWHQETFLGVVDPAVKGGLQQAAPVSKV